MSRPAPGFSTRLRFRLEALAFYALLLAARVLPRKVLLALGSVGGRLHY